MLDKYLAGLFDGEGCVSYKQYMKKRKNNKKPYLSWNIQMEISMTDEATIRYIHDISQVGSVDKRIPHKTSMGKKTQWRWRCGYRDALKMAKLLIPHARAKREKLQQIINHYE